LSILWVPTCGNRNNPAAAESIALPRLTSSPPDYSRALTISLHTQIIACRRFCARALRAGLASKRIEKWIGLDKGNVVSVAFLVGFLKEARACYAQAWENGDLDRLVELLAKDATLSMPPWRQWYQGRSEIASFLDWAFDWVWHQHERRSFRFVATRANGQHAFGEYMRRPGKKRFHAHALHLLTFNKRGIHRLTVFIDAGLFSKFGLREMLTA
jgi:hypothetical protein